MNTYINSLMDRNMRADGRKMDQYRPITIQTGISAKSAEGSAIVTIGGTKVIAGIKMSVGTPFPDKPEEGVLIVNAELIPMANPEFESGPPSIDAIELSRVVDRGLRESKIVDFEKLCIKKGELVWMVNVDIYPLNDEGNLFDAAFLASVAALKDAKFPALKDEVVDYTKHTKELPIKDIPVECTVHSIKDKYFIDVTSDEEKASEARVTVAIVKDNICAMQKGGEKALSIEDIEKMIDLAYAKSKELLKKL